MADQSTQVNQNLNNQNDNDELFGGSDDIFENSDLLQPINSEVDTAHHVVKSQNDLNNFSGEIQSNSQDSISNNFEKQGEQENNLDNDDLFEQPKEEPNAGDEHLDNLYDENQSTENQPTEDNTNNDDLGVNDDIFDSPETKEEKPEEQKEQVEPEEPEIVDNIDEPQEEVEPIKEEKVEPVEEEKVEDLSNQKDNTKEQVSEEQKQPEEEKQEEPEKPEEPEEDEEYEDFENEDEDDDDVADFDDFGEVADVDDVENVDNDIENIKNVDDDEKPSNDEKPNDNQTTNNKEGVVEAKPQDDDEDEEEEENTTPETTESDTEDDEYFDDFGEDEEPEVAPKTDEEEKENITIQDYEKYDPNTFKTDVQKKFGELQWKTEQIHKLVGKDLDVGFDLLGGNDDRQKTIYKILSGEDYVEIEKEELDKETESTTTNLLGFVLDGNNLQTFVNDVLLYNEMPDLQNDPNKKMQVLEKMNKFIFLLDEEYKKIQKYKKEKEERNAVKGVFRNF